MGLSFFVEEIQEQTNEAIRIANEYIEHANTLKDSVHTFLGAPLSGNAYDSAKNYFTAVYDPLSNALIVAAELLIEAHTNFLVRFQEIVGEGDIEEERLLEQIRQGKHLLQAYAEVLDKLNEPNQRLEQAYMRTQEAIRKLEERLDALYLFDSVSSMIFSEVEASLDDLVRGLTFLDTCEAWNPSSGTFDIMKLDLTWTRPVNEAWQKRQKKMDATKLAEALSNKSTKYKVEAVVDEVGHPSYFVYRNGRLSSRLTTELARLLAEFRLTKYQGRLDVSSIEGTRPVIVTVDDKQATISSIVSLSECLAIGYGEDTETGKPEQLLVRIEQGTVTEGLMTVSPGLSELLTGAKVSK
ncbi:hypothetical protein [uncultured Enterococcus sp.]|uniref:hypothetical protein n=1 Tax=uncultured Enterococcus sp. TaxID=167972 RepID=UPI002AA682C9|nr:hypothetical protein [uncultured Enterococcus sp.]